MKKSRRNNGTNRREFLTSVLATGVAAGVASGTQASAAPLLPVPCEYDTDGLTVVFNSSFEPGQPSVALKDHALASDTARRGRHAVCGEVSKPKQACFLDIPFEAPANSAVYISYWARSDQGSACATFVVIGGERNGLTRVNNLPKDRWQRVEATYRTQVPVKGIAQIVAPSSYGAPAGRAWIDDVSVLVEELPKLEWPERVQDFPCLACDGTGRAWMATLERPLPHACVTVRSGDGTPQTTVATFEVDGALGMAAPAIAGTKKGCFVAFPVEGGDGQWRIACVFVDWQGKPKLKYIDCPGTANISPALAVADSRVCVAWESNAGPSRGIHACWIDENGKAGRVHRVSSPEANAYNPAVCALDDGSVFVAWDSLKNRSADIHGAWYRDGAWQPERRLTSDTRIERHPSLAAHDGTVWMAWQAQSYPKEKLNNLNEQRVVVARVDDEGLKAPKGLFEDVSREPWMLLRPRIAFDASGALWLTARRSIGLHSGWLPLAWRYDGSSWSKPRRLMHQQGRWRPVELGPSGDGLAAAIQYDDLVQGWQDRGIVPDWRSGVIVETLTAAGAEPVTRLETEPLVMPETEFSLAERITLCSADLPRLQWREHGLTLYWGDFHDHTDISVCNRRMNPPGHDLFANVRDIEKLDFCALTDHGYNFDPAQWAFNGEQTRHNHDPGRFVTFLGEEWTSSKNPPAAEGQPNRYGHHNLVFLDPYHKTFHDAFDGDISPADLWRALGDTEYLCIPHQLADWQHKGKGNPPTDWNYVDERLQPVAEIFQARQSYEYLGCPRQSPTGAPFKGFYLQDAWAKGIVIGVIASPDHGGGSGKAGVWARDLTRESIFEAVRARHTFGTSGPKMALQFSSGDALMGDKVKRPRGALTFRATALALRDIKELVIFRNNEVVHRVEPRRKEVAVEWTDAAPPAEGGLWYYARIHAVDDGLAWSSPIWFEG